MRNIYNVLQLREVFHLEFLRWFSRKVKPSYYALKGGVNLRFFFNSFRYSEDMDLDIHTLSVDNVRAAVMKILESASFPDILRPFGIERIVPPDITKAKQTQTTQRFKVHLITSVGEDLFTKIEFSRRGFKGEIITQPIQNSILRLYKSPPLIIPHYDIRSAINQKIKALCGRPIVQARDIFDLYLLSSQCALSEKKESGLKQDKLKLACENIFEVSFEQFRDTVLSYLAIDDQSVYGSVSLWDEVKLKTANFIGETSK